MKRKFFIIYLLSWITVCHSAVFREVLVSEQKNLKFENRRLTDVVFVTGAELKVSRRDRLSRKKDTNSRYREPRLSLVGERDWLADRLNAFSHYVVIGINTERPIVLELKDSIQGVSSTFEEEDFLRAYRIFDYRRAERIDTKERTVWKVFGKDNGQWVDSESQ